MVNCKQILTGGSKSQISKVRDERIDSVKYWLIVLVIAGHVLEYNFKVTNCVILWNWIYIFHMPLFVFISGYFSHKKDKKSLKASIWKLLEPLILFHSIVIIPQLYFKGSDDYLNSILSPWFILWYLLSLIYWRLLLQLIPDRILNNAKLIIISTFCIGILAGFLPFNRFLSIQRTLSFMPFFFLGYCMRGKNVYLPDKFKPLSFMFLVIVFTIPIFFPQCLGDLRHADPYDNFYEALQRFFVFSLSIPMSLAFINLCVNSPWIAKQGRLTMQYLIYHALMISPFIMIVRKLGIPSSLISAIVCTLVITIIIGIASYLPFFKELTNPSVLIKRNNRNKE